MPAPLADFDQVLEAALARGEVVVAVASGHDAAALEAAALAEENGLARTILVGEKDKIEKALGALAQPLQKAEIVEARGEEEAASKAVALVRERKAQIVLKGKLQTATLMRAVLDGDAGLRTGRLLSDAFVFEYPAAEGTRLVCLTDGGINVAPDAGKKKQIVENAVELYHALGYERPRVSLLSAVETPLPNHQPSDDALALMDMYNKGKIEGCVVEGPLSLDLSLSREAARKKGHETEVAGRADILLCPEIVSANLLAKATTYFAHYRLGHVIMGAAAPVLIPSRSDTADAKLLSIALGALTV